MEAETEHEHGPNTHTHDDVLDVYPGEDSRVRFHFKDGSYITVHVRDEELRACGSVSLTAQNHHHDVVTIKEVTRAL